MIMKFTRLLLITFLPVFSYGCSDEQPYEPEREEVSVWTGDSKRINTKVESTIF